VLDWANWFFNAESDLGYGLSQSVDISFKDDITFIILLSVPIILSMVIGTGDFLFRMI
jgi:hypothetical protein